jgi:hypothetical protein
MAQKTYRDRSGTIRVVDGSPFYIPNLKEHYETCCDCGMVHRVKFRIEDANGDPVKGARLKQWAWVEKAMTRDERNTMKVKVVNKKAAR